MDMQPEIMAFVKALADADRLRIVGLLSRGSKRAVEIAEAIGVHPSEAIRHLEQLTGSGVVREADGVYDLDEKSIESLARGQFMGKRPAYAAERDAKENVRKVLAAYLNADGTIKQIPSTESKLMVVLNYVLNSFTVGENYNEKEVNTILRRFHADTAALRRSLVDHGMMAREGDGSRYWRVDHADDGSGS